MRGAPSLADIDGLQALVIDGVVQSVRISNDAPEPRGYWPALLPDERPQRTLILGFGGGTVAQLLLRRFGAWPPIEITGVDDDAAVLIFAADTFAAAQTGPRLVQADAAGFLRACHERGERFDLIVVDLFRDGRVPDGICSRRFLGLLRDALAPGGLVSFNLDRGQNHRH
ncbi:MAG: spermidine synthase, partial [Dehalococcoidia bacterium]